MPLACPSCRIELTATNLLEAASFSVPIEGLVDFRCTFCGEQGLSRLADGLAEIGRPAERGFKVLSFEILPELAVAQQPHCLRIWFRGRQMDVPVRDGVVVVPRTPTRGGPA